MLQKRFICKFLCGSEHCPIYQTTDKKSHLIEVCDYTIHCSRCNPGINLDL